MNPKKELETALELIGDLLNSDSMTCEYCGIEWGEGQSKDKNHTKDCVVPKAEQWQARIIKILYSAACTKEPE